MKKINIIFKIIFLKDFHLKILFIYNLVYLVYLILEKDLNSFYHPYTEKMVLLVCIKMEKQI